MQLHSKTPNNDVNRTIYINSSDIESTLTRLEDEMCDIHDIFDSIKSTISEINLELKEKLQWLKK